jgi:lipopolysaccharide export LptBFGC system permease protein LptF
MPNVEDQFGNAGNYLSGGPRSRNFLKILWFGFVYFIRWLFTPNLRLLKIEKYVFGEVWGWYLLGVMGFTFFMIITSLFLLGEKIFSKKIPVYTTIKVLILSAPAYLVLALPVAVLFATLMAMGRLSRDNEITMFVASGVSLYNIFIPFLCVGLYTALLSWSIYEYAVPANNREFTRVLGVFWDSQVVDFIRPNLVIKAPNDKYFYIDIVDRDKDRMYNLRLYDFEGRRLNPRVFIAQEAWIENKFLNLANVNVVETDVTKGNLIATAIAQKTEVDISRKFNIRDTEKSPQELSTKELKTRIENRSAWLIKIRTQNVQIDKNFYLAQSLDMTEYYFKFSIPFASVVFVLVAVPLSLRGPRDERNLGVIQAFVLMMIYYIFFFSFRMFGGLGVIPSCVAAWTPTGVFALGSILLFVRARK